MVTVEPGPTRMTEDDSRPSVIVIGSGSGGLVAAVRLGARGWRVTVVETPDAPGRRAHAHRQDGFTFDAGPTTTTRCALRRAWAGVPSVGEALAFRN